MKITKQVTFKIDTGTGLYHGILACETIPGSVELNNAIVNSPNWKPVPSGGAGQLERPMRGDLRTVPGPSAIAAGVPHDASIQDFGMSIIFTWSYEKN